MNFAFNGKSVGKRCDRLTLKIIKPDVTEEVYKQQEYIRREFKPYRISDRLSFKIRQRKKQEKFSELAFLQISKLLVYETFHKLEKSDLKK